MTQRTAACSCGQLQIEVNGEPEAGQDDAVTVVVGAFADPTFGAPQVSVYDCRRHAWVQVPPDAQRFERDP